MSYCQYIHLSLVITYLFLCYPSYWRRHHGNSHDLPLAPVCHYLLQLPALHGCKLGLSSMYCSSTFFFLSWDKSPGLRLLLCKGSRRSLAAPPSHAARASAGCRRILRLTTLAARTSSLPPFFRPNTTLSHVTCLAHARVILANWDIRADGRWDLYSFSAPLRPSWGLGPMSSILLPGRDSLSLRPTSAPWP